MEYITFEMPLAVASRRPDPIHPASTMVTASNVPAILRPGYDLEGRFTEVLFALSTILVFTLAVERLVSPENGGVHALLVATTGYSLAWAVFVGVMFAVHAINRRGKIARFANNFRLRPDEGRALGEIQQEMDATLAALTSEPMRERLHWNILSNIALLEPPPVRLKAADLLGALATTLLVFTATVPAILPFLCCEMPWMAVRLSNLVTVLLLFVCGYHWARSMRMRPWITATSFAGLGLIAVWVSLNIP
ncbi:MAG: hypothetical protein QM715_02635 [Nibricoccus sp.]